MGLFCLSCYLGYLQGHDNHFILVFCVYCFCNAISVVDGMKWILIFWIYGCSGLNCEIPEYEISKPMSHDTCEFALDLWVKTDRKHRGICITEEFYKSIQ